MHAPDGGRLRYQTVGSIAALYLAAAYLAAMPYFLAVVQYPSAVDSGAKVSLLVRHHESMRAMYLASYIVFGIVLAVLALALHERLKFRAPAVSQVAAAVGLIWAVVLVASGMIFNAGMSAVVDLHESSPAQAVAAWQAIEPIAQGLGGAGGELLGGLWVLLVSAAGPRDAGLPVPLRGFGMVVGVAGVVSVVPALGTLAYGFGVMQIAWFIWLSVVLRRAAPALDDAAAPS